MKKKQQMRVIALVLVLALIMSGCSGLKDLLGGKDNWQAQYDLGMRYLEDGDYEEAILAFTAAIQIDSSRPEAYMARAEAYIAIDEPEKALKDYKKALKAAKADDDYEDLVEDLDERIEELEEWIDEQEDRREETGENDWPVSDDWGEGGSISVTDVYSEYLVDCYGTECCYHIPRIDLPGNKAEAVNAMIYDELSGRLADNVSYSSPDGSVMPLYRKILYTWGIHGDVLSVMVKISFADYEWTEFIPYNISIKSGRLLSNLEVMAAFGLELEGFRELGRAVLSQEVYDYDASLIEAIGTEFYEYIVNSTLADDNLDLAMPYVGPDGNLCMAARLYGAAGAGYYWHTFDLATLERTRDGMICYADHSAQITGNNYTPEEITRMVVEWYSINVTVQTGHGYMAYESETYLEDGKCIITVRYDENGSNIRVDTAEVDMNTGAMYVDGYFQGYLW